MGLALWGAVCAFVATILRNWAAYAAALAGYTAAIIASDELGATGGTNGQAFTLALTRVSEISIGIVSAGIVLAGTDLGGARRRLSTLLAELARGITTHFTATLALAGPELPDTQPLRRDFIRRGIALDPLSTRRWGNLLRFAITRQYCSKRWMACSPPCPLGARLQITSLGCLVIKPVQRQQPYWSAFRQN